MPLKGGQVRDLVCALTPKWPQRHNRAGGNEVAQTAHIREQTLWAISWSTESIGNMFLKGMDSGCVLVAKLGVPPSEMRL